MIRPEVSSVGSWGSSLSVRIFIGIFDVDKR